MQTGNAVGSGWRHPIIAREGWPFIVISLLATLVSLRYGWWSLPLWVLFAFCLQFFRDPSRTVAGSGEKSVASPADGRIVAIETTQDPYLQRQALKISVFMNIFNVHSNRSPVDGKIIQKWYNAGSFVNAALSKASLENERCALHIGASGQDVTCVQIAGLVARRILNYGDIGQQLARGDRFGFIRFGSRVDVYLPPDASVKVVVGDKVEASSSLLAELA